MAKTIMKVLHLECECGWHEEIDIFDDDFDEALDDDFACSKCKGKLVKEI